jgi:tetratricopeptide (TPR) repeat protein
LEPSSVHYNNRGLAYFHFDKLEEAKTDFETAINIDKKDPTIHFNLGNVYLNWKGNKKFKEALRCYEDALRIHRETATQGNGVVKVLHSKGLAYQGMAEARKAETTELKVLKSMTNDQKEEAEEEVKALYSLAIEFYKQSLQIQEEFVASRFHLGLMYHRINDFHEALKCFSKVLIWENKDKTVYIARGVVYQDMGNHSLAIEDFDKAIELEPTQSEAYQLRGLSKYYNKRHNEAIEDFNESADRQMKLRYDNDNIPENPAIDDGRGLCYHALGNYQKAVQFYNDAIEKQKDNTTFLMHRAQCEYDQGQHDKSIEDLLIGLQVGPSDP